MSVLLAHEKQSNRTNVTANAVKGLGPSNNNSDDENSDKDKDDSFEMRKIIILLKI